ncbi:MAG: helix-turn-helix domain-containing protein, partial [Nitrospirota bacterium]|nr:helix-turn-helix domain-containing protein [Nitrospirota bacterium]
VIEIKIPPLRERRDDIEVLAKHFITKFSEEHKKNLKGIDQQALSILIEYSWPGNVRELGNVIERAVVLTEGNHITADDLPDKIKSIISGKEPMETSSNLRAYLSGYEKGLLLKMYNAHNKSKEETAKALGIDLATLYRKFKKYGIEE